ncbi:MAG: Fic family protein [Verrucomicrobia bacterium]|nr:Fic family protein [Verrucomicrobiota bacterium]
MQADIFKEIDALQSEINTYRPLNSDLFKQIKEYYKVGLTFSSNALEGNTLTESETKIVLEEGIAIGGKPLKDHFEAIGHAEAYDFLYTLIHDKTVQEKDLKHLHQLFYFRIDEKNAGKYRASKAFITGSKYPLPKPDELPQLMKDLIPHIESFRKKHHPVKAAALAHKEFIFVHPFIDGNGRTARLLMNLILLQEGYNLAIIPPILRREYIDSLEEAHVSDQNFIHFIARMVRETQKDYLRLFLK